jgi:hypothetical protein
MTFSIFALAAAAAAQAATPQPVDAGQARADGYAQAQAALAGTDESSRAQGPASMAAPTVIAPAPATTAAGGMLPLTLTCAGAGTADKQRGSFIASRWGWASMVSHHDRQFNDRIDVRLFSGDDRIRMPRTMVPGIHGGAAGWFKLKGVVADARSIRASAAVSAFHNPKIYIDRTTGTISISGKDGDYTGDCQVIDASAAPKF